MKIGLAIIPYVTRGAMQLPQNIEDGIVSMTPANVQ